jgi:hypothetical protein
MHPMYRGLQANDESHLWQGDIIDSEKLEEMGALAGHQDYLAARKDLPAFCVVTQTCDLMPNRHVDFISLALVRHLATLFGDKDVANARDRARMRGLLDKITNHRENKGYFYLHPNPPLIDDRGAVVDLRCSFALHKQHYPEILRARKASLAEVFSNKLGWMAGHLFNRVPNQVEPHEPARQFVAKTMEAIETTRREEVEVPLFSLDSHVKHLTSSYISNLSHDRRKQLEEQLEILLRRMLSK